MQSTQNRLGNDTAIGGMRYCEDASGGKSKGGSGIPGPKLE